MTEEEYQNWLSTPRHGGAYDRIEISQVLCSPDGQGRRNQRFGIRVSRPAGKTHAATMQHLDGLTRNEMAALFDRIWEALQQT